MKSFAFVIAAVSAASFALAEPADDIAAAGDSFTKAFNESDPAAVAALFAEDAIALAPGWRVVTGPEQVERMYSAFFKAGFGNMRVEPVALDISGEMAVETFVNTATRTDKEGHESEQHFKVLRVWKRSDDGVWQVHRISFNPMPSD